MPKTTKPTHEQEPLSTALDNTLQSLQRFFAMYKASGAPIELTTQAWVIENNLTGLRDQIEKLIARSL